MHVMFENDQHIMLTGIALEMEISLETLKEVIYGDLWNLWSTLATLRNF